MQKDFLLFVFIFFSLIGCVSKKSNVGAYRSKGKDYEIAVTLRQDSSFSLLQKGFEVNKQGKGVWQYKSKDTILLKFDHFAKFDAFILTNNYVKGDTLTLKILKWSQLKYYKARLKKVKNNFIE